MKIARNRFDSGFESLRRLVAWRRAEIEESLPRFEIQQRNDRLRANILKAKRPGIARIKAIAARNIRWLRSRRWRRVADPDEAFRGPQAGLRNSHRGVPAILRDPPLEQPLRSGQRIG